MFCATKFDSVIFPNGARKFSAYRMSIFAASNEVEEMHIVSFWNQFDVRAKQVRISKDDESR